MSFAEDSPEFTADWCSLRSKIFPYGDEYESHLLVSSVLRRRLNARPTLQSHSPAILQDREEEALAQAQAVGASPSCSSVCEEWDIDVTPQCDGDWEDEFPAPDDKLLNSPLNREEEVLAQDIVVTLQCDADWEDEFPAQDDELLNSLLVVKREEEVLAQAQAAGAAPSCSSVCEERDIDVTPDWEDEVLQYSAKTQVPAQDDEFKREEEVLAQAQAAGSTPSCSSVCEGWDIDIIPQCDANWEDEVEDTAKTQVAAQDDGLLNSLLKREEEVLAQAQAPGAAPSCSSVCEERDIDVTPQCDADWEDDVLQYSSKTQVPAQDEEFKREVEVLAQAQAAGATPSCSSVCEGWDIDIIPQCDANWEDEVEDTAKTQVAAQDDELLNSLLKRICVREEEEFQKQKRKDFIEDEANYTSKSKVLAEAQGAGSVSSSSRIGEGPQECVADWCSPRSIFEYEEILSSLLKRFRLMEESSQKVKREIEYPEVCRLWAPDTKLPKDIYRAQTLYCARIGLASYNKEQGANYKLLEPIASARLLGDDLLHFHSHFLAAKPKTSLVEEYFYSELFFVDFFYHDRECVEVRTCVLIPRHLAKTDYYQFKCKFCPPDLAHPWPWGIPQLFTRCKACKRESAGKRRSARQCC